MKKLIWVLIVVSLLLGCQPKPPAVESYKEVSLGGLTVAIPADWEEDELSPGLAEAVNESKGTTKMVIYRDKSGGVDLLLTVIDMRRWCELGGDSWEGWEKYVDAIGMSKQQFAVMFLYSGLVKSKNIVEKDTRMLTINSKDACEILHTAEIEGTCVHENCLFIFGEDDLGVVFIIVKDVAWPTYKDCWPRIRDSARML